MTPRFDHAAIRFLLFTMLTFATVGVHAQDKNAELYGKWRIKAMIGGGAVGSLSQRQVERLIGKFAIINAERFEFNGQTCTHPNYQRSQEDPAIYFDREWRTEVNDIPFPNPVTIIDTGCDFLYPIRKNHMVIAERGVFFEAVRVKNVSGKPVSAR